MSAIRGTGRTIRANILGVRVHVRSDLSYVLLAACSGSLPSFKRIYVTSRLYVQEARRYHVRVAAQALSGNVPNVPAADPSFEPGVSARTETAPLSLNPEFMNSSMVLRLPQPMGASLQPQALLNLQLWAAHAVDAGNSDVRFASQAPSLTNACCLHTLPVLCCSTSIASDCREPILTQVNRHAADNGWLPR